MKTKVISLVAIVTLLSGCGTMTGIPAHGGGKRFAVEQELVAAASRAALKDVDFSELAGKKVALYITLMGDEGSGVLSGGRYTLESLIRGEYAGSPRTTTENSFPTTLSSAVTEAAGMASTTEALSVLNAPSYSTSKTKGYGRNNSVGLRINGQGDYRNETLITNPRDANFLTNLVQTVFFLRGIEVVPPHMADVDVFITVDVFGTIRSRLESYIYNNEQLRAVTKLEAFAIDRKTQRIVMKPRVSSFETKYQEDYILWMGPIAKYKTVKTSDKLLVDFSDIKPYAKSTASGRLNPTDYSNIEEKSPITKEVIDRRRNK